MYQNKFVIAIKSNGKILKETKDLVTLPFGSEFSVLVKNLNSRRAKFTLHIDGTDVLDGEEIIMNANSDVEMKRFIRNGNMDEGNAFKFIQRTSAIENGPRGIKLDDGLVRCEFWFEKQAPIVNTVTTYHNDVWWNNYYYNSRGYYSIFGPTIGSSINNITATNAVTKSSITRVLNSTQESAAPIVAPTDNSIVENDTGITVPGSRVDQKFHTVYGFVAEEASNVIILRLTGTIGAVEVKAPIIARANQYCSTCGKVNKAKANFCSGCGTSLQLL